MHDQEVHTRNLTPLARPNRKRKNPTRIYTFTHTYQYTHAHAHNGNTYALCTDTAERDAIFCTRVLRMHVGGGGGGCYARP